MISEEFAQFVQDDAHLAVSLRRVAAAVPSRQFSHVTDVAVLVALFPVARFVLVRIGLPWLHTASRWSELKRLETERWLDERYEERGFDVEASEAATKALCSELERASGADVRASWELLRDILKALPEGKSGEEKPDTEGDAEPQSS